jgi:hypothetical protein
LEVGVVEVDEVHEDVVEGDGDCEEGEEEREDESIGVESLDAILSTGDDAVGGHCDIGCLIRVDKPIFFHLLVYLI